MKKQTSVSPVVHFHVSEDTRRCDNPDVTCVARILLLKVRRFIFLSLNGFIPWKGRGAGEAETQKIITFEFES